jgi:hypothetical protein
MRRIIDNYLQVYADKLCYRLWQHEWRALLKPEVIARFKTRRGFLPPILIDSIFAGSSSFALVLRDSKISVVQKLILLTGLNKFSANASAKAIYYTNPLDAEYAVGEYRLTGLEVLSLCQVVLKRYYSVNIDMRRYLKHLSIFIPWQSLTTPLKRFSAVQRKDILSQFGKTLDTYTESEAAIKQAINISIL